MTTMRVHPGKLMENQPFEDVSPIISYQILWCSIVMLVFGGCSFSAKASFQSEDLDMRSKSITKIHHYTLAIFPNNIQKHGPLLSYLISGTFTSFQLGLTTLCFFSASSSSSKKSYLQGGRGVSTRPLPVKMGWNKTPISRILTRWSP